jgi:hypothetical protein
MRTLLFRLVIWGAAIGLVSRAGFASGQSQNPYQAIAARNCFGLLPEMAVEPLPKPAETTPPLLPRLVLTGLTDMNGRAQVLFDLEGAAVRPGVLEKDGAIAGVRIVDIDVRRACVKVAFGGSEMELAQGIRPAQAAPARAATAPEAGPPGATLQGAGPLGATLQGAGPQLPPRPHFR